MKIHKGSISSPLVSLLITAIILVPVRAQQPTATALPKGVTRVTSVEGITEYRLDNGLRVLLFPDQSKQTITVNLTYMVGSRHENYGETGMAHLLEHLMFKGTPTHSNIMKEMTERGGNGDATTSFDRTNYFFTLSATDANLEWAVRLEADRMVNSNIAKKDLDSEMTVVRNEFESGENNPTLAVFKRIFATAFDWHNYANLPIGARSDIENVPIERLQAFYRTYYQPDNAVMLIAGKFDEGKALSLISDAFGRIPRPTRVLPTIYTLEPTQDGERTVMVRRVGDTQMIGVGYKVPAGSHPDFAALSILSYVLGDTPSGRLHKALVETKKAASIGGFTLPLHDPGLFFFTAEVRKGDSLDAARDTLLQTIEETAAKPPAPEEVERARTALLKDIELTLNSSGSVGLELSEWMAQGDWRLFFIHRDRLRKVTPADVQRVATHYLKQSNRTVAQFIPTEKPERAEIPPTPDIAALVRDYKGEAAIAEGEAFDPSPANILARTTEAKLPGGIELALLPKKTRGNTVVANLTIRFGDEKSLMNRGTVAELTSRMLMRGTTKHTRQQIQEELDKLKARVGVSGGANLVNVSIETVRDNLPAVIRLVAEVLREPSFPASEFEQLKQEQITGIESQRSEPQTAAMIAFTRHIKPYPKGDVRYAPTLEEAIENTRTVTLDDLKKFHKDFYGANYATMSVVGDFEAKEVERLVAELFDSWKSPVPFTRLASVYRDVAPLNESIKTPDKANAFFVAGQRFTLREDDPDYPALLIANYIIGSGALNSRLATRIRQKEGISYQVGSVVSAHPIDRDANFTAFAIYAPQNVSRLEAAFREEIERALKEGFTAEEVATARAGYLQAMKIGRSQDAGLAAKLSSYLYLNRSLSWDAELENKLNALTPEQVTAALRKYVDPSKMVIIKAGDFAKADGK